MIFTNQLETWIRSPDLYWVTWPHQPMRSLHLITWPALGIYCIGNCIILGIALHWDLHFFGNCTAIGIALYCELHCIGNCIILGIAMYWKLHCIENCIVLRLALFWELHCIENCIALDNLCNILEISLKTWWQLLVVVVFV